MGGGTLMGIADNQPIISVIMPARNSAEFIYESIMSVREQSFEDWELIVADNGSTDGTAQLVHEAELQDSRIHYYSTPSELPSVAETRRFAISKAAAPWIAFLDSDDLWAPDKLEKQLLFSQELEANFVFTASDFISQNGNKLRYVLHAPKKVSYPRILHQDIISCSSVLIRKELLSDCFTEDTSLSEDYSAWIRILRDRERYAYGLDEPLLHYRLVRTSLSSNKFKSAVRTYKTYRHMGISFPYTAFNWTIYVCKSLLKYGGIYLSGRERIAKDSFAPVMAEISDRDEHTV